MVRQYPIAGCSQTVMYSLDFQLELNDFTTVSPDDLTAALGFQIYNDLKNGNLSIFNSQFNIYYYALEEESAEFQPNYDPNLKVFYLMKNDDVYIPVLHTKAIDFRIVKSLHKKLKKRCVLNVMKIIFMFLTTLFPISNIFLAIVDNTANILYYQMSEGLSENQSTKTAVK